MRVTDLIWVKQLLTMGFLAFLGDVGIMIVGIIGILFFLFLGFFIMGINTALGWIFWIIAGIIFLYVYYRTRKWRRKKVSIFFGRDNEV